MEERQVIFSKPVLLPGGIPIEGGVLKRNIQFHEMTGSIEQAFSKPEGELFNRPSWVSYVLAASIKNIGDHSFTLQNADNLTIGDRIFLMLQLAILYSRDLEWLTLLCSRCHEAFDVPVKRSGFTAHRPRSKHYPFNFITIKGKEMKVRGVCGEDQKRLVQTTPQNPERFLLDRCILSINEKVPDNNELDEFTIDEKVQLERAIEDCSPDMDCSIAAKCPDCGTVNSFEFEPYWLGQPEADNLDTEIHKVAWAYHWSEREILSLTRKRRLQFLELIKRERNKNG
jgi:hypothetical protein